ncbi:MAG: hypothetical protein K2Y31_14590 [Burkholderiales bacterium]|jgi:hypothetical protein|nr:hypothetical protein [Burkholderiales bacterium]
MADTQSAPGPSIVVVVLVTMTAQIARLSPPGMVSVATGGIMVWIFGGILVGPALFAATYRWLGSYTTTFGILALVAVASAVLAFLALRAERAA